MNLGLKGKIALITGSSQGIGKAIATSLHQEGCNVMLNGRDNSKLENLIKKFGKRAKFFVADVINPDSCKELVDEVINEWGRLDILVCNVGGGIPITQNEDNLEIWEDALNKNLYSTINMVEASTKELTKSRGSIVCISSIAGMGVLGASIQYSTAKAALNTYVRNISRTLAKYGIRINVVAPGNILFKGSIWERKLSENRSSVYNLSLIHI